MNRKLINILLLFALWALSAKAQEEQPGLNGADQLKKQLSVYLAEHPSSNLYLHLDKNIYSPEETIWFKAYLLADTTTTNKVLYVRITNEDKEVVLSGQFPMYDIRAHGSILLYTKGMDERYEEQAHGDLNVFMPKILEEGKYTLYAYTDRMLSYGDTNVFVQQIRIRKHTGRKLEAEAGVSDTAQLVRGGKVQVMARVRESGRLAKNVDGEYELRAGEKTIKYGRLTTNQLGEALINFTYPKLVDDESLKVKLLFTRGNDFAELSLNLPHEGNPLKVNIHPEGGQLLAGVAGKVAIEVLDIHDHPVSTELLVKKAGQLLFKVRTNKQGIASVSLKPETNSSYTVETASKKKQTIPFPQVIKPEGYSLKLHNSKDQCTVTVYNKNQSGNALLVLRSAKEILWSKPITIAPGDSLNVPVPTAGLPKNILSLSVFDSENKTQAERLFLNREQEDYKVTIQTDRQDYGMQKKVTVTINISDAGGNPVVANLSVAATEKNRIDSADYRNILQSWYYQPFGRAKGNRFLSTKSVSELDGLLVAGNWDNNRWSKISAYLPQGPPLHLDHTDGAIGQVVFKYHPLFNPNSDVKKLRKIYIQSVKNHGSLNKVIQGDVPFTNRVPVNLDANYQFYLPSSSLLTRKGEEWMLDIYEPGSYFRFNFLVEWKNHDIRFDSMVVKGQLLSEPEIINSFASAKIPEQSAFSFKGINQLAEVTIGGKEKTVEKKLRKQCPDRACTSGAFNCTMHPNNRLIKGMIYAYGYTTNGTPRVATYLGCTKFRYIHDMKNITIPEEFPLPDYGTNPSEKEDVRSTIYWNPNIVTNANGTATFSFYTSDIQGEFEIMAQGLEVNTLKPLMGTGSFKVTTVTGK